MRVITVRKHQAVLIIPIAEAVGGLVAAFLLSATVLRDNTPLRWVVWIAWMALAAGVTRSQGVPMTTVMKVLSQNASVMAYDYVFRICALLFIAALPILFLVGRSRLPAAASAAPQQMAEAA